MIASFSETPQLSLLRSRAFNADYPLSGQTQNPCRETDADVPRSFYTQASSTIRDSGDSRQYRQGHSPHLSISDENHHVTEAIGDLYGYNDYDRRESRPLSFIASQFGETLDLNPSASAETSRNTSPRPPLTRIVSNERRPAPMEASGKMPVERSLSGGSNGSSHSPSPAASRRPSETATAQFPLNNIDYESNPAAVAQELSNLQALRRMSMDATGDGDPDLPSFNTGQSVPSLAPRPSMDEDDASTLFWVPARVHPELAPKEFKSFLEKRVDQIKRRSGENSLSPEGFQRAGSAGGLRRKKSMLSRQIDNSGGQGGEGYTDGAERLERKRSLSSQPARTSSISRLQDLEELVGDPSNLMRRLSLDSENRGDAESTEVPISEDRPILAAPLGHSLRRSTRTAYGRGSLRKGERVPLSKRAARVGAEEPSPSSPLATASSSNDLKLSRAQTDPSPGARAKADASAQAPVAPRRNVSGPEATSGPTLEDESQKLPRKSLDETKEAQALIVQGHPEEKLPDSHGNQPSVSPPSSNEAIPRIVETPPPEEDVQNDQHPKRSSSFERPQESAGPPALSRPSPSPVQSPVRAPPPRTSSVSSKTPPTQTLKEMAANPSPLPGNSTRTDSLSFIPTFAEEKKTDKKKKDKESGDTPRKSSWGWLLGSEEKEKDKERDKEREREKKEEKKEEKEAYKRSKGKHSRSSERPHENTRLDVLQTSIDGGRGRESLVLDRESIKLDEERKKESTRKTSGDAKKEKESGLFSSLFGGSKKKGDRESTSKKSNSLRAQSPEIPYKPLRPDVDYNWTRFSILEERAIYRMAHIKLANPRRALYSQVLLSNFMYSYLAKVQQMHPHVQVPQSPAQRKQQQLQQEKAKREQEQQQLLLQQQQQQQKAGHYQYQGYPETSGYGGGGDYAEDSQAYEYDHHSQHQHPQEQQQHQGQDDWPRPQSRASRHNNADGQAGYEQYYQGGSDAQQQHYPQQQYYHQYQAPVLNNPNLSREDEGDNDDDMW
ncbi:hypothetical protein L228DRAFT_239894 [Xylona heveae TC161]|uniref:Protein Zds1 C-terminal domain-containing protein n=1 Tax=Xylona heveae (strain CBS 132557 / TC161) TaxID=1328760 RepID=A0A165FHX3_XYLHT|nr:hypothetical protein L228DRAFT_239894 [Xylona heveae TC161]KZF20999.1 hypothetical protein L228DRAFT_239894 [Xylona heveae TC161]